MINNPKDLKEIIDTIDNLSFEQLDEAIRRADEMNEEEIEEFIEQVNGVEREYKHKPILVKNVENIGKAIQSALNMYQQEKEKNKKLEEENKYLQDYLEGMEGGLKEQIKEQSRTIAELEEQLQES